MFVHAETIAVTGWLLILRHAVRAIEEVKFLTTFAELAMVVVGLTSAPKQLLSNETS